MSIERILSIVRYVHVVDVTSSSLIGCCSISYHFPHLLGLIAAGTNKGHTIIWTRENKVSDGHWNLVTSLVTPGEGRITAVEVSIIFYIYIPSFVTGNVIFVLLLFILQSNAISLNACYFSTFTGSQQNLLTILLFLHNYSCWLIV